jgi:hypothetical protein
MEISHFQVELGYTSTQAVNLNAFIEQSSQDWKSKLSGLLINISNQKCIEAVLL